jgi:hypothetical protein
MAMMREIVHYPAHVTHAAAEHKLASTGVILLVLGLLGLWWLGPEIRRYIKLERM